MSNIIEALQWRYATKQFDPEKKLSAEQLHTLKEALRLAPSSFGLQPWHFVIVEDTELRKQLRAAGYDQPQITDASHFLVLATEKNVDAALVDKYLQSIAVTKNIPVETLEGFRGMLNGSIEAKGEAGAREWAVRQVYIALGVLAAAAAVEGIDMAPMEGFDPQAFDAILGLDKRGLVSRVMVGLGFRKIDDPAAQAVKVRYAEEQVFTTL
ncbi:MAG: NAD(P)H-dependent oxidoreductase [Candidatus Moraniibacteriota bacterium]